LFALNLSIDLFLHPCYNVSLQIGEQFKMLFLRVTRRRYNLLVSPAHLHRLGKTVFGLRVFTLA